MTKRPGAGGLSCGGLENLAISADLRVAHLHKPTAAMTMPPPGQLALNSWRVSYGPEKLTPGNQWAKLNSPTLGSCITIWRDRNRPARWWDRNASLAVLLAIR
jgi:hypothetical protein